MILSQRGIRRLEAEEWNPAKDGLKLDGGSARYFPYRDYKGFPTIGVGHLIKPGEDFSRGLTLSEVYELLHKDLHDVYKAIEKWVTFPYNQSQFDSMVITGHNTGPGFFFPPNCKAIRALNAGNVSEYLYQLTQWNKSGKPPVFDQGLFNRREREAKWFMEPLDNTPSIPPPYVLGPDLEEERRQAKAERDNQYDQEFKVT